MSEYDVLINKYDALKNNYDQLYPKPMKHANTHAKDGSDPITPASIGAYTKTEADALLANKSSWSKNKIDGSVLDWAASQNIPTSGYTSPDNTDVPSSSYWLVNVLMSNVDSNWKVVVLHGIANNQVWYNIYNCGNWNGWKQITTATDLDTKVSKSGDTMTGELTISKNGSQLFLKGKEGSIFQDYNTTALTSYNDKDGENQNGHRSFCIRSKAYLNDPLYALVYESEGGVFDVIHTGNAQPLGFPKIAIGSYVGTGTYSSANPNSLTFDFEPKMLAVVAGGSTPSCAGFLIVRGQTYSNGIGSYSSSSVALNLNITWAGKTVSWWSSNDFDSGKQYAQMNASGVTYFYVALG